MSDSNIGARKGKSFRNLVRILKGINHEDLSSMKNKNLIFTFYYLKQMFNSMVLTETLSEINTVRMVDDSRFFSLKQ